MRSGSIFQHRFVVLLGALLLLLVATPLTRASTTTAYPRIGPLMMTVLFYQFPSGLVLYWMVSNFLGIAHQMLVGRRMKREA